MNKFQRTLITGATTATLLLNTVLPAFAATTIQITGNGSDSENEAEIEVEKETTVLQTNNAYVVNDIDAESNTGDNEANKNTGSDVTVKTGDAKTKVNVENDLNHNTADVDRCGGCDFGEVEVKIADNGAYSENEAELEVETKTLVTQDNHAYVKNDIEAEAETGDNEAEKNTGGSVTIETGDAKTKVSATTAANSNAATVGGDGPSGKVSATISGNGYDSENEVELELEKETWIQQANSAYVKNDIEAESETGDNEAEKNTGGDVTIKTGDAKTSAKVMNTLNANSAWVKGGNGDDGGWIEAIIRDNGADSENEIELELEAETTLWQNNNAFVKNDIDAEAETGENEAEKNTGGEAMIETGDAKTRVHIDNMMNFNVADVECDCLFDNILAKIAGNGYDSENEIEAELEDELFVSQDNCGDLKLGGLYAFDWEYGYGYHRCATINDVDAESETGDNEVEKNTDGHDGDPSVETGDAYTKVEADTSGNVNVYGDPGFEWPMPTPNGTSVNFNFSFDLNDLLAWLLGQQA